MGIRSAYFQGILEYNYASFKNVYGQLEYKLAHKMQLPINYAPFYLMAWYGSSYYFLTELKDYIASQHTWKYNNRHFEQFALLQFMNYLPKEYYENLWSELVSDYARIVSRLYDVSTVNTDQMRHQSQLYRSFMEWSKSSYLGLQEASVLSKSTLETPEFLDYNYRKHLTNNSYEFLYSSFYPCSHWWWHVLK